MTESSSRKAPGNKKSPLGKISLRLGTKITLGNILIVLLALISMGYFVYNRSQVSNKYLIDQYDESSRREIENLLSATVSREANTINLFFSRMNDVSEIFGHTTKAYISGGRSTYIEGVSWNAFQKLSQLPNGNWDNDNSETAAIYVPGSTGIGNDVAAELAALKGLDYFFGGLLEDNPEIIAVYFGSKLGTTVYYPNIDLASILPAGFDVTARPWYTGAINTPGQEIDVVWSAPYEDAALNGLVITSSYPIFDQAGEFRGVSAIDVLINTVSDQVSSIALGRSGYGFLIDKDGRMIAIPDRAYADFNLSTSIMGSDDVNDRMVLDKVSMETFEVLAKMTSNQTGVRKLNINGSDRLIAFRPIPFVGYSLGLVVEEQEMLSQFIESQERLMDETQLTLLYSLGIVALLLILTSLASIGTSNTITAPLNRLTEVAEEITAGNLNKRAEIDSQDEIGILAKTLNSMTSNLQGLIGNLEERVEERTRLIERRALQIQAAAEVGKTVVAQRDLNSLLGRTTQLVSERFGFYHVGIFLLDDRKEYAILSASNSSGGARMLARGHKLRVGEVGIVGAVAGSGAARIALDVGKDAIFFDNPDLPQTRSEMALPLVIGGDTLGILDIQSVEANAFSEEDISTLQIIADQLAIALQNAGLFNEIQEALSTASRAYTEASKEGWQHLLESRKGQKALGYIGLSRGDTTPSTSTIDELAQEALRKGSALASEDQRFLFVPIQVRGTKVGVMRLVKHKEEKGWAPEEIEDISALADQISTSLESARLYEDAQRRAAKESAISDVTSKIGTSVNLKNVLWTAVEELGRTLGDSEVQIQFTDTPSGEDDNEE
jgi:GAF domain-containing protein/HAMP domain-containing protein